MKRYEILTTAALVTLVLGMLCPMMAMGGGVEGRDRRGQRRRGGDGWMKGYQCRELASSFAVTNKCSRAFLTVSRNQAFVQREGLNSNHPDVELLKEVCTGPDPLGPTLVRFRHAASNRYICFNNRGRVKTVEASKVVRKGRLCMFSEERVDEAFHRLGSAAHPSWYLGFNRRRLRPGTPTLPAHPARRANMVNRNKCEAHFHTARLPPRQPAVYSGLLQVLTDLDVPQHSEQTQVQEDKTPVSRTAAVDLGISRAHAEALAAQASLARAAVAKRIRHRPTKQLRLSRKLKNLMKKYQKQKNKKKKKKRAKQA